MNKTGLVYRSPQNKRYSIETLFSPLDQDDEIEKIVLPENLNSFGNLIRIIRFGVKIKPKLIHITGDVHYLAFLLFWKKSIITIHDLNHYEELQGIRKFIYGLIWFYLPLKAAKKIVAISPYTKEQLQKHFRIKEQKIVVIPNSFLKFETTASDVVEKDKNNFQILCIGGNTNKNIGRLIEAIEGVEGVSVRIIGKQNPTIMDQLKSKKINYSIVSDLSRTELEAEYKASDVLYFASTKEGFGLPILEAQSLGIPVITSTTTAMPYVAGTGAILVDPYNIESIRKALLLLINKEINSDDLKEKGYKNTERFSESNFIKAYKNLYKSML
ncbi:glycosyltransferase [Flavobacterium cerinum]|uniref:Glycosyltransferase n=1 Tax=Flavobacterium cerinum TaxID=2502784 RepID=A0ABY5IX73_9FLAO|nr:glycosyltransferase [Flavobacterium cerinum]UUC47021.1 glycosyltransferase [Flavobacterium cerinum]